MLYMSIVWPILSDHLYVTSVLPLFSISVTYIVSNNFFYTSCESMYTYKQDKLSCNRFQLSICFMMYLHSYAHSDFYKHCSWYPVLYIQHTVTLHLQYHRHINLKKNWCHHIVSNRIHIVVNLLQMFYNNLLSFITQCFTEM